MTLIWFYVPKGKKKKRKEKQGTSSTLQHQITAAQ